MKEILGVDFEGVIKSSGNEILRKNYLKSLPMQGAFETIQTLRKERFDRIYLVSKCTSITWARMQKWFERHHFYEESGISAGDIYCCRRWCEKARICKELGITHFIDDRIEVLRHLVGVDHRYLFKPTPRELHHSRRMLVHVDIVNSWAEVIQKLLPAH